MNPIRVSVVSYLNSLPFAWCLQQSDWVRTGKMELSFDVPSVCADKLCNNKADVGLIPLVEVLRLPFYNILPPCCISAHDEVRTVILTSPCPPKQIKRIVLDKDSRNSAKLVRLLCKEYWHINPKFEVCQINSLDEVATDERTAVLVIGDKVFDCERKHFLAYKYDIAQVWREYSGKACVFACWVANKELPEDFMQHWQDCMKPILNGEFEKMLSIVGDKYADIDVIDYWNNSLELKYGLEQEEGAKYILDSVRNL